MAGIKEVARIAEVSVGTVSNVLNRPETVSPPLRERVEQAIAQLGFVRNESARQLRAGSSRTIAAVVLDAANPFFTDVLAGVEQAAELDGGLVVVCNSGGDPGREQRHLARLEEQRVLGLLLTPVLEEVSPLVTQMQRRGIPVILLDQVSRRKDIASVSVDDLRGGQLAGDHLIATGHREVAFIGGPLVLRQVRERLEGVRSAGGGLLRVRAIESQGMSVRAGAQAAAQMFAEATSLAAEHRPTALFCANDLLALGALNECLRRGVRVPHDLALVGYDDISFAASASVPLTSVRQPREQLGRTAVELLLEQTGTADGDPASAAGNRASGAPLRQVLFAPELVVRDSTRRRSSQPVRATAVSTTSSSSPVEAP